MRTDQVACDESGSECERRVWWGDRRIRVPRRGGRRDDSDTDTAMGAPHRPGTDWQCRDDEEEWPCQVFRRRMWSLYRNDRDRLAGFMAHFRDRAIRDLDKLTPDQAEARFLGWINDPPDRRRLRSV